MVTWRKDSLVFRCLWLRCLSVRPSYRLVCHTLLPYEDDAS